MKAWELIPSSGTRILCLEPSSGGEMAIPHTSYIHDGLIDPLKVVLVPYPASCLEAVPWASCPSLPAHHSYDLLLWDGQGRILERAMKEACCEMPEWVHPQVYKRDMLVVYSRVDDKPNVL